MPRRIRFLARLLAPSLAALVLCSCGGAGDALTGASVAHGGAALVVLIHLHGNSRDADGFGVSVDGMQRAASFDSSFLLDSLTPATHTVHLDGIATHCRAASDSVTHSVRQNTADTVAFDVTCVGGFAYHEFTSANESQIFYLGADGRTIRLTSGPGRRLAYGWSPDGSRLLFSNDAGGESHLFSVRVDGSDLVTLTSSAGYDRRARWSPDGARIAYAHQDSNLDNSWLVVMNADGSAKRMVLDSTHHEYDPEWSSDGTQLYFSCSRFGIVSGLCTAAPDGSGLRPLRYAAITALDPPCTGVCYQSTPQKWEVSPDGRSIAFETLFTSANRSQTVWIATLNGTSAVQINPSVTTLNAKWSPIGDRLVVATWNGQTNYGLATVNRDGTAFRAISNYDDDDSDAGWSPDGQLIAFQSRHLQIWAMNADGSARRPLTSGSALKYVPVWNPKAGAPGSL